MKALRCLTLCAALLGSPSAQAMEVTVIGNTIILTGAVVGDELPKVRYAFAANGAIDTAILRNSWGGDPWTGYRIGELFRDKGLTTGVSGYCVSSCSRMFLGGKRRVFTDDYPPSRTFVGFHGHYDNGRLDIQSVSRLGLYHWIIKHSDGKADPSLVRRWVNIERNTGAANFMHPDVAQVHSASAFFCEGTEKNRPLGCQPLGTNALERGVITDLARMASPDQASLVRVTPDLVLPRDVKVVPPAESVSAQARAFSGKWFGRWNESLDHILVVEDIQSADGVTVVYAPAAPPGYGRFSARIDGTVLEVKVRSGQATARYRMSPSGTLDANFEHNGQVSRAELRRFD